MEKIQNIVGVAEEIACEDDIVLSSKKVQSLVGGIKAILWIAYGSLKYKFDYLF